jgi:hypothetical protein
MPVVNMGIHAGLGLYFQAEMAKENICENDIVILSPTSFSDSVEKRAEDVRLLWQIAEKRVSLISLFPRENYYPMFIEFPHYVGTGVINKTLKYLKKLDPSLPPYRYEDFNEYGDNVYAKEETEFKVGEDYGSCFRANKMSDNMINYLNDYNSFVVDKGARFFVVSPPILEMEIDSKESLNIAQDSIEDGIGKLMISQLSDYVYPINYFYDTGFHLNSVGKCVMTKQVIEDVDATFLLE